MKRIVTEEFQDQCSVELGEDSKGNIKVNSVKAYARNAIEAGERAVEALFHTKLALQKGNENAAKTDAN